MLVMLIGQQMFVMQVPTFRADPLTPSCDTWCEFPVSDRPNAVVQFLKAAKTDPTMIKVCSCMLPASLSPACLTWGDWMC